MKTEEKVLRIGTAAIVFAVVLRLFAGGLYDKLTGWLVSDELTAILLYAGTGKVFRPVSPPETAAPTEPPAEPETPTEPEMEPATFSADDAVYVSLTNHAGYSFDTEQLLQSPLSWDLTGDEPTVLILHSHACESYENTEGYTPSAYYRTADTNYNMVSVGTHLAQCLEEKGIRVIHDTALHDGVSYNDAYKNSRAATKAYLEQYPSIRLVLDIHRDAYEDGKGNQASNTLTINGQKSARLMIVSGTDAFGEDHGNWSENLSTALKLQATLEKLYPGLCRPLSVRSSAFNQDLSPGALLIEVGTAGDERQAALQAAALLADGIAALAAGSR